MPFGESRQACLVGAEGIAFHRLVGDREIACLPSSLKPPAGPGGFFFPVKQHAGVEGLTSKEMLTGLLSIYKAFRTHCGPLLCWLGPASTGFSAIIRHY